MLSISGKANDNSSLKSFSVKTEFASTLLKDSITMVSGKEHSFTQSIPTTGWPAGEYTMTFTSTDAANNVSAATVIKVNVKAGAPVDNEKPKVNSIGISIPMNNKLNTGFTNKIKLDVSDNMELASITVEVYRTKSSSIIGTGTATIVDPKSFVGDVNVTIGNISGVFNDVAEIRVKATDKAGNVTNEVKAAVIEF
jgi:hypothetical protein